MDIITRLHDLRSREHLCTVDLIEALVECDRTRAYLDHGYDSLWNFLVDGLQYSNAAASRRLKAMKCARKFPAVIAALREQRVTLSSLEAIEPLLSEIDDEIALFDRISGKSFAQVKEDVARDRPAAGPKREVVRREFVKMEAPKEAELFHAGVEVGAEADAEAAAAQAPAAEARVEAEGDGDAEAAAAQALVSEAALAHAPVTAAALDLTPDPDPTPKVDPAPVLAPPPALQEQVIVTLRLTPEEFAIIEHARAIASRKPGRVPTVRETLVEAARFYVAKRGPKQRPSAKPAASMDPSTRTRHIPSAIRDEVMLRDGEQCTFVAANGRRCPATHDLHVDHIDPYSLGGPHELDNLRVLCGAHNRRRADKTFGRRRGRMSSGGRSEAPPDQLHHESVD